MIFADVVGGLVAVQDEPEPLKYAIFPFDKYRNETKSTISGQLGTNLCHHRRHWEDTFCFFRNNLEENATICYSQSPPRHRIPTSSLGWWNMSFRLPLSLQDNTNKDKQPGMPRQRRYMLVAVHCGRRDGQAVRVQGRVYVEQPRFRRRRRRQHFNCRDFHDDDSKGTGEEIFEFFILVWVTVSISLVLPLLLEYRADWQAKEIMQKWKENGHAFLNRNADDEWLMNRARRQLAYNWILAKLDELERRQANDNVEDEKDRRHAMRCSRVTRELLELRTDPIPGIVVGPSCRDCRCVYFCLEGTRGTPTQGGIYCGKIMLAPNYPICPPHSFLMMTPSGIKFFEAGVPRHHGYHGWNPMKHGLRDYFEGFVKIWQGRDTGRFSWITRYGSVDDNESCVKELAEHSLECCTAVCPNFFDMFPGYRALKRNET